MEGFNQYIKASRGLFNNLELPQGHEDRFTAKLKQRNRLHLYRIAVSAAATVVLILSLTGVLGVIYNQEQLPEFASYVFGNSNSNDVLVEMDSYYHSQLLRKYRTIEQLALSSDPSVRSEVISMMAELEREKQQLEGELKQNPRKDYVVEAMLQNYQVRMAALQRIQESLSDSKR
ncbi:MAG: hypothetical protein H6536_03545 [Bacteroidales bacterium]|nr:hypothetical protein [Bacteroidales bacterium]